MLFATLSLGAQPLVFERTQINDIRLSEDDSATGFVFAFKNEGSAPSVITRVETSCGCAVADYPKRPLAPGATGEIKITYNPKDRAGTLASKISVYTADSSAPVAQLELNGDISPTTDRWSRYPEVLGELRASRRSVSFGAVYRTQLRKERIVCVNSGTKPLKLSTIAGTIPDWISLQTVPEVIEPGVQAELLVVIDGRSIPADVTGRVEYLLLIDGMVGRPSQRSVMVEAEIKDE
jgi:hypothetical protein